MKITSESEIDSFPSGNHSGMIEWVPNEKSKLRKFSLFNLRLKESRKVISKKQAFTTRTIASIKACGLLLNNTVLEINTMTE